MAYSEAIKERAYALYLQGKNPEQITSVLKVDNTNLSANTIRNWAEQRDSTTNETWEDRKLAVDKAVKLRIEAQAKSAREQAKGRVEKILSDMYSSFLNQIPECKSAEGFAHAFKSLSAFVIELEDREQDYFNPLESAEIFHEAIGEDKPSAKIINERWPELRRIIARKLNERRGVTEIIVEPENSRELDNEV
jgi:hypothetical protein